METLRAVAVAREGRLLGQLAAAMAAAGAAATFEVWMKQQSDLVQATAAAYAQREVLEASIRALQQVLHPIVLYVHTSRLARYTAEAARARHG